TARERVVTGERDVGFARLEARRGLEERAWRGGRDWRRFGGGRLDRWRGRWLGRWQRARRRRVNDALCAWRGGRRKDGAPGGGWRDRRRLRRRRGPVLAVVELDDRVARGH